jgi:Holliday junction resolvase
MSLRDLANTKPKRQRFTRTLDRAQVRRMKKRGYDAERELVKKLRGAGFAALRVPVSAPSNEPLPDVFAIRGRAILAFEVKSQARYAYYKRKQITKLFEFLEIHKIYPERLAVLAAKFKYKGWVFQVIEKPGDFSLRIGGGISFRELMKRAE